MREALSCVLALVLLCLAAPGGAAAERLDGEPAAGMTYGEVIKLWGPPLEKREKELKREEEWRYAEARVIFRGGRVASWSSESGLGAAPAAGVEAPAQSARSKVRDPDASVVQEIMTEIMKESP